MKGVKEIKSRIRAVDNASKITLAMQLVAASKMKRAQDNAISSRPYLMRLMEIVARLSDVERKKNLHPFFAEREGNRRCIIVISTDRGLCGVLNNNLFRCIPNDPNASFISVGRKAMQFLSRGKYNLIASFSVNDRVQYHELTGICDFVGKLYLDKEVDSVEVLFQHFVNTLHYIPSFQKILPMVTGTFPSVENVTTIKPIKQDPRPLIFEPSKSQIIDHIARIFLKYDLHQVMLEAKASEQSARMIAMKNATDNAEALSQELKLDYNKARQYAITNEIIELAAAAGGQK